MINKTAASVCVCVCVRVPDAPFCRPPAVVSLAAVIELNFAIYVSKSCYALAAAVGRN